MPTSLLGIAKKALFGGRPPLSLHAAASICEEPGAGKPHAGICAGAVGQLAVLPRSTEQNQTSKTPRAIHRRLRPSRLPKAVALQQQDRCRPTPDKDVSTPTSEAEIYLPVA